MTKQDKAYMTIKIFKDGTQMFIQHVVLDERVTFGTNTECYGISFEIELREIERDKTHDYEMKRFPELKEKEQ